MLKGGGGVGGGGGGDDGEAEGMLTLAPPDHQATCFNIHDITSSPGRAGAARERSCARQAALIGRRQDALCPLPPPSLSLYSLSLFLPLSTVIGCSHCYFKLTLCSAF